MVKVDVLSDSKFPVNRKMIRERIADVLKKHGMDGYIYVSVIVVGDRKMHAVNKKYRHKDYTTDVLSFPTTDPTQPMNEQGFFHPEEEGLVLGDILVSYPQAVLIASKKNQLLDEAVGDLVEHGLMHLMGFHHE